MPITAYHGTTVDFDRFELGHTFTGPDIGQGHISGVVGIFFSACPKVASTFTVTDETADEACNRINGAGVLLKNPYFLDGEPWRDGAQVLTCELDVSNPMIVPVRDWENLIDTSDSGDFIDKGCPFEKLRNKALSDGYDHIIIPAAKPGEKTTWGGDFAVEYSADNFIILDPERIRIMERTPSDEIMPRPAVWRRR